MEAGSTVETHRFIAEICKREYLWNRKKLPWNETRKKIADRQWDELCTICNISKPQAKTKWRGLRNYFYKKIEQVPLYSDGNTYYMDKKINKGILNKMNFLLNTYKPRSSQKVIEIKHDSRIEREIPDKEVSSPQTTAQSINNFHNTEKAFTLQPDNASTTDEIPLIDCEAPLNIISVPTANTEFKSIKKIYTVENVRGNLTVSAAAEKPINSSHRQEKAGMTGLDANESELNHNGQSTEENSNLSFFRSLLPFMDQMDPLQQLHVRMQIQDMIFKELRKK